MYLSTNIRYLRLSYNLTKSELANKVSKSISTIERWEAGTGKPDIDMILRLATIFKVMVDILLFVDLQSVNVSRHNHDENKAEDNGFLKKLYNYQSQFPAVCINDSDKKVVYVNAEYSRQTGYSLKEIKGKKFPQYMQANNYPSDKSCDIREKLDSKQPLYTEMELTFGKSKKQLNCQTHIISFNSGFISFAKFEPVIDKSIPFYL